jgi:lysophospholipase L1-like esterase
LQPRPFFVGESERGALTIQIGWIDSQGRVRETLFDPDRLHLNPDGYRLWGRLIRRRLLEWLESEQ